jgi:putative FmdB family regulatory protein
VPIFDFSCKACGQEFEALVRKEPPKCPHCQSADLERLLSLPIVRGDGTKQKMLSGAKKRDAKQAAEREYTQRQYEAHHDD